IPLLRLTAGFEKEKKKDPLVIYFATTAKTGFDKKLDALKMMNTHPEVPSFYSLTPDKKELSINALPASQSREIIRIPLGYDALKAGKLQFELQDLKNLPQGLRVYLVDLERNTYTDLQQTKIYSTQISKGRSDKRFELVLSEEAITEPGKLLNLP